MSRKKLAIVCGGPSAERGISLNSARSLFDNLDRQKYDVSIFYFNSQLKPYELSAPQIYSNTPLDFDYKLGHFSKALNEEELEASLKKVDVVFPVIHGIFGEDGQLQTLLEKIGVPYVGSGPKAMRNTSDKSLCQQILQENGFYTFKHYVVKKGDSVPSLSQGKYVIKPLHGGSSIGVHYFESTDELRQKWEQIFQHEDEAIIEPYCDGKEFTIIVLQNGQGRPVALFPTEIEFKEDRFFDYRKKYLASTETRYHTPARYEKKVVQIIRSGAEKAFECLQMRDFARLDGWILKNGEIWFSDVNGISGMEQNSFIFQQAGSLGLSHRQLLDYIISKTIDQKDISTIKEEIPVIFGGNTAERQVSIMSGTNVWIKLKSSEKHKPIPLFLSFEQKIYHIPHFLCLHHTVEEIEEKIELLKQPNVLAEWEANQSEVFATLGISGEDADEPLFKPKETNLEEIAKKYKFLFLGLHGGVGEDGTFQAKLDVLQLPYNGPGVESSHICMDKFVTGQKITEAKIEGVTTAKKILANLDEDPESIWQKLGEKKFTKSLILKPRGDGCSAGVLRVNNKEQFKKAVEYFQSGNPCIPGKAIHENHGQIDLPSEKMNEILIEEYIDTDKVVLKDLEIQWETINGMIEVTIGVIGGPHELRALNPSQTIASQEILSLEEKFMGGTGINLTPPPSPFVKPEAIENARKKIAQVAQALKIEGYSRIDAFMDTQTGNLIIIEANTLPGLTPSTVIYHQALAENPPMTPLAFIEKIIEIGKQRFRNSNKKN